MRRSVVMVDPVRGHSLPPELARSVPRDVRLTRGGRALTVLAWVLAVAAITAGVLLYREARRQAERAAAFDRDAVVTTAVVDRLWRKKGDDDPAFAAFHFDVQGRRVSGESRMRTSTWRGLKVGAPLTVRYLPDDPDRWMIDGSPEDDLPVAVAYLVGSGLMTASLLCIAAVRRQRTLLSEGRAAVARIISVKKHQGSHGSTQHEIRYEFPVLGGGTAAGRGVAPKTAVVGSPIHVLYDPDRPARNQQYPFSLVEPETLDR